MRAPILAVGDGALGFWKALGEVFPQTKEKRCWFRKPANVLAAPQKSAHSGALAAMKEIYNAEDADTARAAITAFERDYGAKFPKAVAKIVEAAEARWRAVNAPHPVVLVRAGAVFEKGNLIERPVDSSTTDEAA